MSIEDVAHETPEKIHKIWVDPSKGVNVEDLLEAVKNLDCHAQKSELVFMMKHLYDAFMDKDCDLVEINPLVITKEG